MKSNPLQFKDCVALVYPSLLTCTKTKCPPTSNEQRTPGLIKPFRYETKLLGNRYCVPTVKGLEKEGMK